MLWLLFAFLSPLLWSMNSVLNKIMLSKIVKNPLSYFVLGNLIHTPLVFLAAFFFFPPTFSFNFFVLSLISSILGSSAFICFLFALRSDDASKVGPLSKIGVIFTLILAFFFLGEELTLYKYFGIVLILVGVFLLSYKKTKGKFNFSPALVFVILSGLFFSSATIMDKYILDHIDFWSRYVWGTIGANILAYTLYQNKNVKKHFFELTQAKIKYYFFTELNSILGMGGLIAYFVALSLGQASLVSAIGATGPLMTLILAICFSLFIPRLLKEEITKKNLAIKLFSIITIIVGVIITII